MHEIQKIKDKYRIYIEKIDLEDLEDKIILKSFKIKRNFRNNQIGTSFLKELIGYCIKYNLEFLVYLPEGSITGLRLLKKYYIKKIGLKPVPDKYNILYYKL